jgi:hypothetical protein
MNQPTLEELRAQFEDLPKPSTEALDRFQSMPMSEQQTLLCSALKVLAGLVYDTYKGAVAADPRYMALAITHLEQSVMWAVKAISRGGSQS